MTMILGPLLDRRCGKRRAMELFADINARAAALYISHDLPEADRLPHGIE